MSVPVELSALRSRIADHGESAYLVTVNEGGTPHVVSVVVAVQGERLLVGAGRSTRANLGRTPAATLLWPAGPEPHYSLLVDVDCVDLTDEGAALVPRSAVLHRLAGAPGDGPTCVPVADRPADA